jgi:hypothetical protein
MNYSHFQHRHNFSVWCAARAVQRKFTKTPVLKEALEKSGVAEFIRQNEDKAIFQEDFDKLHTEQNISKDKTIKDPNRPYLLPDEHALSLFDRNSACEPESGDQMDQRRLCRVFQSQTKTLRSSVPRALQSRAGGRG